MVPFTVFVPIVVVLFATIIGVYVYVHREVCKSREELIEALRRYEKSVEEQVGKLGNHISEVARVFQEFRVEITDRLARIETMIKDQE